MTCIIDTKIIVFKSLKQVDNNDILTFNIMINAYYMYMSKM